MILLRRLCLSLTAAALACGASVAAGYRIDGAMPDGGDCARFGQWITAEKTCRVGTSQLGSGDSLTITAATVEIDGTLTNDGLLDNRGTLVVNGFLDSQNDLVNFWDGRLVNRGEFFSHFMYNFGPLTNEPGGTIEFEFHLENNAPMTNHGHIDIGGTFINIPARRLENLGSLSIAATGALSNAGTLVHAGRIENLGSLQNEAEFIEHCESDYSGNPVEGLAPTGAQSLYVEPMALTWCPVENAHGYDVVEGDLALLRSSAGDFSVATTRCLGSGLEGSTLGHDSEPGAGEGTWFLVRANGVSSADYDTVFTTQVGTRAPEIAGSPGACR